MNALGKPHLVAVWLKGHEIAGYPPHAWRRDDFGYAMRFADYGDRNSDYGWEIDHRIPSALGGPNMLINKRPLHWRNNVQLGGQVRNALSGR
ncbi:hypothetical protein HOC_10189 [Hyphomonas oceanitis SCH89]|uniref:HNH endonuclease n=1 Tax=Hyphomonas oceanitis SCH89 TaxID=1280953 RepID=A0A059G6W5_9PROT|nr:hypothetical protein HOC_10189 [Hyphomonas oceanitis SCH89]